MILVTGGTGFLGAHLLFELLNNNENVRAIKRESSNLKLIEKIFSYYTPDYKQYLSRVEWICADVNDYVSLDNAMQNITKVYHCAAVVSFDPSYKDLMFRTNVEGTANIVNLALKHKIEKLCYVSSIAAIGRSESGALITEETAWKNSEKNSNYSKSKNAAEREIWRGIEEGLNAVIVNPSVILGPGEWEQGSSKIFQTMWKGNSFYTEGVNGYVDVKDVARVMYKLMNSNIVNQRYIVSTENLSYKDIFTKIMLAFNKKPPQNNAGILLLNLAWRYEKLKSLLFNTQPLITKETVNTSQNKYFYSAEKLKQVLSFEFISIDKSIKDTCELYVRDYKTLNE
ncbi:MAG: SDR family oxidoreductase [Bacteroidetes bacterium]|nr:SDR family oxidoreductase [Bacteroidota bacterium]